MEKTVLQVLIGKEEVTCSVEQEEIDCTLEGIFGDRHYGATKLAGVREKKYAQKGEEILNLRQVSIVSESELSQIARNLGIAEIIGEDLGANIVINGIEDLTKLSRGTIMSFSSGTLLYVTGENLPCVFPGENLQKEYEQIPNLASAFPKAAKGLRGLVAIVLRPGRICRGETVEILKAA